MHYLQWKYLYFDSNFVLWVQLTVSEHWFLKWFGDEQAESQYLNQCKQTNDTNVRCDFDKYISGIILGLGSASERRYKVVSHWLSPWPKWSLYKQDKFVFKYFTTDKKGQLCNDIVIFTVYQKSATSNIILSCSYRYRYHNNEIIFPDSERVVNFN